MRRERPEVVQAVRRYTDSISDNIAAGKGLTFQGDTGTGKTTLAMLVSSTAVAQGHSVAIYALPRLLAVLRDTFEAVSEISLVDFVDRLSTVELLHIDDVGAQQATPWALEQLYSIINERYEAEKAVVVTTDLAPPELRDQIGKRIVSRLEEMNGKSLMLFGDDMRIELNRERKTGGLPGPGGYAASPLVTPEVLRERGWH